MSDFWTNNPVRNVGFFTTHNPTIAQGGGIQTPMSIALVETSVITIMRAVGHLMGFAETSVITVKNAINKIIGFAEISVVTVKTAISKTVSVSEVSIVVTSEVLSKIMSIAITELSVITLKNAVSKTMSLIEITIITAIETIISGTVATILLISQVVPGSIVKTIGGNIKLINKRIVKKLSTIYYKL